MNILRLASALLAGCLTWPAFGADPTLWQVGTARTVITPDRPLWLAGYASRDKPAQGKTMDLWLKMLALEDAHGHRALLMTSDLLGVPQSIYQHSCTALKQRFNLEPDQILLTASHTHSGPVLRESTLDIYNLDDQQRSLIADYSTALEAKIIATAGAAFAALAPARLEAGRGIAGFAVNRRNNPELEVPRRISEGTLRGPVDHSVPVLAVFQPDGTLKAVLFGYACHNTVMDTYTWSGDYAGFAQLTLEHSHPDATAMFFMGCGGDQNPLPRRRLDLAERYGNMLAAAVEEVLRLPLRPLPSALKTSQEMISLPLGAAPTETELNSMRTNASPTARRWAARLAAQLQTGQTFIRDYPYPVQAWEFGGRQLLVCLGGEPVVDYASKFKARFGSQTWVAGYCNDVMAYIPSLRVLKEDEPPLAEPTWGYEGSLSMFAYGLPAYRWGQNVEDLITAAARRVVERVQAPDQ